MTLRSVKALEDEIAALEAQSRGEPEVIEDEEEDTQVVETETKETPPENLSDEEKTYAKRYADLRRLQQAQAKKIKELEAQKAAPPVIDEAQVKEWVTKNPKAAEIVKALAREVTPTEDLSEIREEIARTKAMSSILKVHPDFEDITESDEFHTWADAQPKSVQELIFSDKPEDVIWALNSYKDINKRSTPSNKDAAKIVKTKTSTERPSDKSTTVFSESQVQKMPLHEYEKREAEILEAQRKGNFVYDLSGAAR